MSSKAWNSGQPSIQIKGTSIRIPLNMDSSMATRRPPSQAWPDGKSKGKSLKSYQNRMA